MAGAFFLSTWTNPAFIGAALLTRFLIGWASRVGALDRPNERSSHTRTTPRGGGLSIVVATTMAEFLSAFIWPEVRGPLLAVGGASLAVACVSWLDDLKPVRNRVRFGVHLISAAAAAYVAGPIEVVDMGDLGTLSLGLSAWPLTVLWMVGMTNAFNFMDGIDGIAGITATGAGAAIAIAAACLGCPAVAGVGSAFAGAAAGFLVWNWPPAKIFMGDVGSAFCGFTIAALPLIPGTEPTSRLVTISLFAMWPFIFDTIFTLFRRLAKGENVFEAHRSHLYQRLVIAGWSHQAAASLYGILSASAAAISLSPFFDDSFTPALTKLGIAVLPLTAFLLLLLVRRSENACGIGRHGSLV
jgi:UDP-N-acetylmuramyl pentapeptide phosphotransferase/UDP-N-acetylglucosamine-1-phosphate transferase